MPPTPIPRKEWLPVEGITPLSESEGVRLAERLPVVPWFVLTYGGLRHGSDRAFVKGPLEDPEAVVVQHRSSPSEPEYFGKDPGAAWSLLSRIPGWFCVNGPTEDMKRLVPVLARELRLPYRGSGTCSTRCRPPRVPHSHPSVRLLGIHDIPLLQRAVSETWAGGYRTYEEALTEGVSAGAIIDGQVVSIADSSAANGRYADIGVKTLEPYRRQGLSSAAVVLWWPGAAGPGLVPIWQHR